MLYTVLGCLVESLGMIVVTVPLLYPVLLQYGIDPIWFGVILVLFIEMGQISPPIGINLFVIQSIWTGKLQRRRDGHDSVPPHHVRAARTIGAIPRDRDVAAVTRGRRSIGEFLRCMLHPKSSKPKYSPGCPTSSGGTTLTMHGPS